MIQSQSTTQVTDIKQIKSTISLELEQLNQVILNRLGSDIPLIQLIIKHILQSGGKRIRPLVTLLIAKAFQDRLDTEQIELAAIIEFVHTATLLHDDVIDHSRQRRGQFSANALWGNSAAVLVGDFLYSRSFQLLTERCNNEVMRALANTTNAIAEGEILQLANQRQCINESQYSDVIFRKTAILFASACECAAILAKQNETIQKACFDYGRYLGMAFQVVDDILDYTTSTATLGKEQGNDIQEGKMTLPLIYFLETASTEQQQQIRNAIENPTQEVDTIIVWVNQSNALQRCQQVAKNYQKQACQALQLLPTSAIKQTLIDLSHFAISRIF